MRANIVEEAGLLRLPAERARRVVRGRVVEPDDGIGLATAEAAIKKGAKLVLAARSDQTLKEIVAKIQSRGGMAMSVTADVTDRKQLEALAQAAA